MNSRPWLAVAVYVRAPVADAPIATDMAANSDSTLTYSHGARSPVRTSPESASTMCVCGEIGYAGMTSGRHRATVSATAREPSICLSGMERSFHEGVRRDRGCAVAHGDGTGEARLDGGGHRPQRDDAAERSEAAEQGGVRERPAQVLAREVGGGDGHQVEVDVLEPELRHGPRGVDQYGAAGPHAAEEVDLVQQRGVLHDQRVGLHDRLAHPDRLLVDAAEGDDRRARPLRAEARERLSVALLEERRERRELGRRDDALATAAVDTDCEHVTSLAGAGASGIRARRAGCSVVLRRRR